MYPLFHEADLPIMFEDVRNGRASPAKNFIVLMIVAISLQRLETKYAAVADSYYLGALAYFEDVVRAMNLETLQCCALVGEYSLLTPTRTAAWYIIGIAIRLAQQLNLAEEQTIVLNAQGQPDTPLNIDIKRRAFWSITTMDYGLAHSLGRPAATATAKDHINVKFFQRIDDRYIHHDGIKPGPVSIRKWIAIHFYNMRLLQLDIRRTLYLQKRPAPTSDADPWFKNMEKKLIEWKNASPTSDEGSGFSESWFKGRYHTMIVFLYRPSPQVPRPSARAALLCYDACEWNIYMHRDQMIDKSVEMTWAWTQSIFMAVNTILWSLAYVEVREKTSREQVQTHLEVAIDTMKLAAERWPGVASAVELYEALIGACLHIFDHKGDVHIQTSPYAESERTGKSISPSPRLGHASLPLTSFTQPQPSDKGTSPFQPIIPPNGAPTKPSMPSPPNSIANVSPMTTMSSLSNNAAANAYHAQVANQIPTPQSLVPPLQYPTNNTAFLNPLPTTYSQLSDWHFTPTTAASESSDVQLVQWPDPEDASAWNDLSAFGEGINQAQHYGLMEDLQNSDIGQIHDMVEQSSAFWQQKALSEPYE